ncbi:hypothetical protein SPAB_00027 [Salmonella enterica subsp. enterica serovar Paratyphi B str. SPB7]|uniref:Uncharacterized protein n=1 Tax=Salmonella paratyphi B (strain ATCC BAA-1250 / SPB7) TaxID=1016998 RepID=A0A6C6YXE8_SALPB|nr:hypothetical protein SPAB_00027 [Salmonella enterica subsp. enterica serovar Paratyphi B str. SPB7]
MAVLLPLTFISEQEDTFFRIRKSRDIAVKKYQQPFR